MNNEEQEQIDLLFMPFGHLNTYDRYPVYFQTADSVDSGAGKLVPLHQIHTEKGALRADQCVAWIYVPATNVSSNGVLQ